MIRSLTAFFLLGFSTLTSASLINHTYVGAITNVSGDYTGGINIGDQVTASVMLDPSREWLFLNGSQRFGPVISIDVSIAETGMSWQWSTTASRGGNITLNDNRSNNAGSVIPGPINYDQILYTTSGGQLTSNPVEGQFAGGISMGVLQEVAAPGTPLMITGTGYPDPVGPFNLGSVTLGYGQNNLDAFTMIEFGPAAAVPVPAALWLFSSGALLIAGFRRKAISRTAIKG